VKSSTLTACAFALCALPQLALGYPLDAYEETGMLRLEAYRLAQTAAVKGRLLPPGAQLKGEDIALRLIDQPDFEIPAPDPALSASLEGLLREDADGYAIAMLDLTDPANPRYAAHNPEQNQNPGSVGKLMVGLAWFQALADVYPGDNAARDRLHLFRSFDSGAPPHSDVPDPYYGGPNGFEDVFDICEAACRGLLAHLREVHELP
jgi:hypothetical protein